MEENNVQEGAFGSVQLKELLYRCLGKWYWFVISLAVCLAVGTFMVLRTPKQYTRKATIMIKETNSRHYYNNSLENMLSGGMSTMSSKLSNEMVTFKSPALMGTVVERLKLDVDHTVDGRFHEFLLYGTNDPCEVTFLNPEIRNVKFVITPAGPADYTISKIQYAVKSDRFKVKETFKGHIGDTLALPSGAVVVTLNESFKGEWTKPVNVYRKSIHSATAGCCRRLSVGAEDMKNKSDVLNLNYVDYSIQRAEDVLNTLINVYNENWVDDNNRMAVSTNLFISDRLHAIELELGDVDSDISDYKSSHLIPDVKAVSTKYVTESAEISKEIQEIENRISLTRFVSNYLMSSTSADGLIPASTGISENLSVQIQSYNNTLLKRNRTAANSSEQSPLVLDMDAALKSMKETIIVSVNNEIGALQSQLQSMRGMESRNNASIAQSPTQAKYLLSVERQQKVKESLYLYLLQKREENELGQAFTAYNTKVITPPYGSFNPTSPQSRKILLIALLLGLLLPFAAIYGGMALDTKVRTKDDLKDVTVPIIGVVPFAFKKKRIGKTKDVDGLLVVKKGSRNLINEAFRIARTNLEFMSRNQGCNVVAVTSARPGSGKSFTTANLAFTIAMKGKKVLIVDGDLRHASASKYVDSPKVGFSAYLSGQTDTYMEHIVKFPGADSLDVLPVGAIPPNPTELIGDKRFESAIAELRSKYDLIFIDCPPANMLADVHIVEEFVDKTIFIVRAGLLEKAELPAIEKEYKEGKYKGLCMILNGTEAESLGHYGAYRSGYYGSRYYHSYMSSEEEKA